ncbi:hypothetical protein CN918_25230 [Priestia megaterium]|nr:hypothetical protein CN918_25230 [Priestia megaterium]
MNYQFIFGELFKELRRAEGLAVRNIRLLYNDDVYRMVISVLDFGQRVEIRKDDEEYFIFVQGVVGLEKDGIVHEKNAEIIYKIIARLTPSILNEIVVVPSVREKDIEPFKKSKLFTLTIPKGLAGEKTKEQRETQLNRILDRYNDYLFLYQHPDFHDEKYIRKAQKIMNLLKKKVKTK